MAGHLFIVAAPSGAGKTTLVRMLLANDPEIHVSISSTTRQPRPGEENASAYYFISEAKFLDMIEHGEFLEWASVHGNYYGTSKHWVAEKLSAGYDVLLEIDWQGAQQVRKSFPESIGIFILPPSINDLEKRLSGRATDSSEIIAHRLAAAKDEMSHVNEFDYVIINDDLHLAFNGLTSIINASRLRFDSQCRKYPELFQAFELSERE